MFHYSLLSLIKNWTLPVAIAVGVLSYLLFAYIPALDAAGDSLFPIFETLLPLTLFCTLFVTFSKVDFHLMRLQRWHLIILCAQLVLIAVLTLMGESAEGGYKLLIEAVLMCVIAPCASASPVVTAKLGGDLTQMTTFVLLSSLTVSLLIPAIFPLLEPHPGVTFMVAFWLILRRLSAVLLLPLLLGVIVRQWVKPLYKWFMHTPDLGFYCWSVSLAITTGITVRNIVRSHAGGSLLAAIAALTFLTAILQFVIGRFIGYAVGEKVCTGQGMFQKNTGLAIWIAYVYLTPIASIGAGCYVLWQNIINSYELWQHRSSVFPSPDTAATPTA